jgi:hypothetical protein
MGHSLWLLLQHADVGETHVLLQAVARENGKSVQNRPGRAANSGKLRRIASGPAATHLM